MAQSTTTNANLSYMNADSKPADAGQNLDERSPRQQNDVAGVVAKEDSRDDGSDPEELLSGDGKSWRQWAVDQVKYAADGVAAKSGYNELLPKELDAEEDKTWRRWAAESAIVAKDVAASSAIAAKDAAASKAVKIKDGAAARVTSAKEAAMANAAYVRDVAASKRPGDGGGLDRVDQPNADSGREKKSASQNLVEAGLGVKESLASRLGYASEKQAVEVGKKEPSVQDVVDRYSVTSARTPEKKAPAQTSYRKVAIDTGLGLKDSLAIHLGHGPSPDSPAAARAASVKEQAVNTALTWRDTAVSTLNPSAQEKVLSKTITDSISSIPTLLKEKLWVSGGAGGESTDSDDVPVSTHSGSDSGSEKKSPGERPPAGLVNRVAAGVVSSATGVVSSATGVVSSYLPTSVASYLPGPKSPQIEKSESKTAESTEVTFEEKLDHMGPQQLMELWTIGNGTLDWTVNTGAVSTESCETPGSPRIPNFTDSVNEKIGIIKDEPRSPTTRTTTWASDAVHPTAKEEEIAAAHRRRVALEAKAYLEAEFRKVEAHAHKMEAKAEKHRVDDEAKALEALKKEELRAGLVIHNTEAKAEKLLAKSKSSSASIEAAAAEQYAKDIANAKTKAERWKAEIEEVKRKEMAEIRERVEHLILTGELPEPSEHKGVVHKVKEKVFCHLKGH